MQRPRTTAPSALLGEADGLVDEHVFLIGRPPVGEFLGFVEESLEGGPGGRGALMSCWRAANDHLRGLERDDSAYAHDPPVRRLPDELHDLGERLLADALTRTAFGVTPFELGLVELDRLVVFQKHINIAYVRELQRRLGDSPSPADLFRLALPLDRRLDPPVRASRLASNVWTFSSPSRDFRVLEQFLLEPAGLPEFESSGAAAAIIALLIGYGSNYLSAIRIEDRLVLNNGSHRAYALREAGHTHAPCLIQYVSRRDELEVVAAAELYQHAERYLDVARPPVLRDYFDDALRIVLRMPSRDLQVRVTIGIETSTAPRA